MQIPLFQIKERIKNMKKTQKHKLTALLLSICLTLPLFSMTVSAASGTEAIEYMKVSGTAVDSGIYAIVSSTAADGEKLRILHHTKNSTSVDRCVVKTAGETLTPVDCTVHPGTNAHSWVISASENGYTIQINRNNGRYINIDANGITAKTASPQYFQIQKNGDGYTISRDINGQKYYLTYDHENGWTSSTTAYKIYLYKKPVYAKISNRNVDDGFYSIVSSTAADGEKLRILHHTRDSVTVDRCQVKTDGRTPADTLAPEDCVVQPGTSAHHWLISASSNGYSIQINRNNGRYLNINTDGLTAQTGSPQYFQIQQSGDGYTISRNISGTSYYLTYDNQNGWTSSTTPYKVYLYKKSADQTQIASGTPGTGTTQGQPFPSGTGGSANFRIPSLITLDNGNLAAAITLRDRDEGTGMVGMQALIYPAVNISGKHTEFYHGTNPADYHTTRRSKKPVEAMYRMMGMLTGSGGNMLENVYLQGYLEPEHRYASPILDDFHEIPPTLLAFGEHDFLAFENFAYARHAVKAGVPIRTIVYRGLGHGFADQIGVMPQAEDLMAEIAAMMKEVL